VTDGLYYHDRESIQPRAFALRHLLVQDIKFRLQRATAATPRTALERIARGADFEYDGATREFAARFEGAEVQRYPLDAFVLYHRGDLASAQQARDADTQHWDRALEQNRRTMAALVDALLARVTADAER
jgi:hypothetical protein